VLLKRFEVESCYPFKRSGLPTLNLKYPEIKTICIYGTGGVGGYYGGKIAEALSKVNPGQREVYFIARGEHLKAIKQNGIMVKTPERVIQGKPTGATDNITEIPAPDLALVCTKSYDLPAAVQAIRPQVKDTTVIIPLLNGIDIYERIRQVIPNGIILPACLYLGTHIEKPGIISQSGGNGIILSGKDPRYPSYTAANVKEFFRETGIGFEFSESPYPAIWGKYIFIAAFGLVTASCGKSLGEVMADPALHRSAEDIIKEIAAIAGKKGVALAPDIVEATLKKANNFPPETRTSYQRDIEAGTGPNEGDLYGGTIIREGAALGIPTPGTEAIYARITTLQE
jgi:2-dehydropantoate 2-reductase